MSGQCVNGNIKVFPLSRKISPTNPNLGNRYYEPDLQTHVSVVYPTFPWVISHAVTPAQHQVRSKLQWESSLLDWIPTYQVRGRLIKSRMTRKVKQILKRYVRKGALFSESGLESQCFEGMS